MADSATVRVTGPVLRVDVREGVSKADGRPYRMPSAKILVGEGTAECTLPAGFPEPSRGEYVDWLADVTMDISERWGASLRIRVLGVYDGAEVPAALHAAAL